MICNFDMSDVADDHHCRRSVRMNGTQPLYCPHPELERQRTATERLWVERLLMWQHAKHGLAYLLGGEDRPEDSRDIDAPQGTYAWLRDDPPDWSVYINQTLDMIGADQPGVPADRTASSSCPRFPLPGKFRRRDRWTGRADARRCRRARALQEPRSLRHARRLCEKGDGFLFCDASKVFVCVQSSRNACIAVTPLAFQRWDTNCMLAFWGDSSSRAFRDLGDRAVGQVASKVGSRPPSRQIRRTWFSADSRDGVDRDGTAEAVPDGGRPPETRAETGRGETR